MNIKELAGQANERFELFWPGGAGGYWEELAIFAELVAAHTLMNIDPSKFIGGYQEGFEAGVAKEREECAKFCETNQVWVGQGKRGFSKWGEEDFVAGGRHQGMDYADAIRARSKA